MWKIVKWTVIVVAAVLIAAGYLFSTWHHHGQSAVRINCAGNLKMIGLALRMYASDNDGFLPRDLYSLVAKGYAEAPKLYFCPEVKHDSPKEFPTRVSFKTDYHYAWTPGVRWDGPDAATRIVALDCAGNHKNYGNVLFADGHVKGFAGYEWYREAGFDRVPQRTR